MMGGRQSLPAKPVVCDDVVGGEIDFLAVIVPLPLRHLPPPSGTLTQTVSNRGQGRRLRGSSLGTRPGQVFLTETDEMNGYCWAGSAALTRPACLSFFLLL
jgi:hypothetical protein